MDQETKLITTDNQKLQDLIGHEGWLVARNKLAVKILDLQNVAEYATTIEEGNAAQLLIEMKANAKSAEILFSWLREIEGSASQANDMKVTSTKSYLVNLEE